MQVSSFDLYTLLWPAIAIFMLCLVVTYKATKWPAIAIFAAFVKTLFFVTYFGWLFDGTFTFLDDWKYLKGGEMLLNTGVGVSNIADNWALLLSIGGGKHVLYYLYNTYAFRLFGVGYYAPVALNIILTIMIAFLGARLATQEFGLSYKQGKLFYLFLLFQPDILAWSNIMNGKDILILLLHVLLLQAVALLYRKRLLYAFLVGVPIVMILAFLRFYVPILFVVALLLSTVLSGRIRIKDRILYLLLGSILTGVILSWIGQEGLQFATSRIQAHFVNPFYGFLRMLLTPIPFNTAPSYAFLDIPALFHWLLVPFVILGVYSLRKRQGVFIGFFLVYVFVFISLYAVFGELQGPRHRIQLDYAFAILQFIGLMVFAQSMKFSFRKTPATSVRGVYHSSRAGVIS